MTARTQDSPFRETAWDQRLDKMLDDLKTTVSHDGERTSSRRDNSLVSPFRSTSRSESRNSNRSCVEDGGLMKHEHKEYTSPDKTTRVVTDQFEYESQDPQRYKKKVMKSTYSNYKVSGDISSNLDDLRQGPDPAIMAAARAPAEQTDSTRGPDGQPQAESESNMNTMNTIKSDSSTLTRLNKNIKELDSMLESMEVENPTSGSSVAMVTEHRTAIVKETKKSHPYSRQTENFGGKDYVTRGNGDVTVGGKDKIVAKSVVRSEATQSTKAEQKGPTDSYSTNSYSATKDGRYGLTNGKPSYEDDLDAEINKPMGGEVRKIVWRNRFEKTYEGSDGTPTISIEEEARRRNLRKIYGNTSTTTTTSSYAPQPPQRGPISPRQLHLQYAVYWPNFSPNISPGGQPWADPIPMPTPPQVSPKAEPGVAYVYTYGHSGSQVQHLPPLNYVTMPGGTTTSIPPSEGAPSPTPSGTQPIIYHYSYHYTLQPGQTIPEGMPHPPGGHPPQPALQMAPLTRSHEYGVPEKATITGSSINTSYDYKKQSEHVERSDITSTSTHHHHHHHSPERKTPSYPAEARFPRSTYDEPPETTKFPKTGEPVGSTYPEGGSNRNLSITINKTTSHVTHTKDYPSGGPSTSTPFPTPGRERSTSPDRYPRSPGSGPGPHGMVTHHIIRTSNYSDSLERLRRAPHEGLPFPDTSPIKPSGDPKIPKRVDDLMTSLSDSVDVSNHRIPSGPRHMNGPRSHPEREPLIINKVSSNNTDISVSERKAELKKEDSKNVAGPPVYYPPGHHQLFDESMHTMTLKENKRRCMAKWRMEEKASGYKESSSSSQSKGGMAMVPVCLPLCCGAACAIM